MNGKRIKTEDIGVVCFYLAFIYELVLRVLEKNDIFFQYEQIGWGMALACYLLKILCTKYTKKEWIMIALFGVISVIALATCGNIAYLTIALFVIASKGIDRRNVMTLTGMALFCMTILVMVRCLLGINGTLVDVANFGRGGDEMRYRFGFSHANQFHYAVFCIMAVYLWLQKTKANVCQYLVLLIVNTAVFYLTRSRTGAGLCYLMILGNIAMQYCKTLRNSKLVYKCGYAIFTTVVIFAVIAVRVNTDNYPLLWKLDMMLTGRFNSAYRTLTPYHLGFIANTDWGQTDMGLAMQAYQLGLLYTIIFVLLIYGLLRKIEHEKKASDYILLLAVIGYIFTENQQAIGRTPSESFIWLLLIDQWYCLFRKERGTSSYLWRIGKR